MQINCKTISDEICLEIKTFLKEHPAISPKLNVIMVGHNPASEVYVRNKKKACMKVGIGFNLVHLDETAEALDILYEIDKIRSSVVDQQGVMVQLPLPKNLQPDTQQILEHIHWSQDVDCLKMTNLVHIWLNQRPIFIPCTALGIMKVIQHDGYTSANDSAVVIGRSNIVGRPMAALLTNANMTVTQCHSHTDRTTLEDAISKAKVIVCAVGQERFLDLSHLHLRSDAIIFDVGINRTSDGKLCGDCYWGDENLQDPVIRWTPVPGGVGVMTVTGLLINTLHAALLAEDYDWETLQRILPPILRLDNFSPLK